MTRKVIAFACAAFAMTSGVAFADVGNSGVRTVEVRNVYDLSTSSGAEALYNRLQRAAKSVCDTNSRSLRARNAERACEARALGRAVAQVNQPTLTALHQGRDAGRSVFASLD